MNDETTKENPIKIDETTRLTGEVADYNRRRGFGYIIPEGADKEDKKVRVFVHWKQIQSDAQWPSLSQGQKVQYYLGEQTQGKQKGKSIACNVTNETGGKIEANTGRNYLDKSQRFKGTVKYWNQEKGFGYIKIENDVTVAGTEFKADKDVYVPLDEIVTDDEPPALKLKDEVEFTLYTTDKGNGAGQVTKPGGEKISFPKEDRPKRQNRGFGPMKGMMGIQFINGMPYALMPKGNWGGGWGGKSWGGQRKKREQGADEADGTQPNAGELADGQEIRAKWKDGKWYNGKVNGINTDGTIKVYWTAFRNHSENVKLEDIRVGGTVPAEAMETTSESSGGGAVHKW